MVYCFFVVIFVRSYNPEAPAPAKKPDHSLNVSSRSVKGYTIAPAIRPKTIEIIGKNLTDLPPFSKLGAVNFNSWIRIKTITEIDPDKTKT